MSTAAVSVSLHSPLLPGVNSLMCVRPDCKIEISLLWPVAETDRGFYLCREEFEPPQMCFRAQNLPCAIVHASEDIDT